MEYRIEKDSMGEIRVPKDKYWGAQTERSLENFKIGDEKMSQEIVEALAYVKKAAALANFEMKKLDEEKMEGIVQGADSIIAGNLGDNFPLSVWQTGSGTQSNMNVNEVISNFVNFGKGKQVIHPNDHVNMSQSSNDVFPTAMNIAGYKMLVEQVIPELEKFIVVLDEKSLEYENLVKIGRTHLQDAVPLTLGQEFGGWRDALIRNSDRLNSVSEELLSVALGGTAVGTGLNSPKGFDQVVARKLSELLGYEFFASENKFTSLSFKSEFTYVHGALSALATDLMKIANDIRWLASGPRSGIGELVIPANEPGSSIMPGKVNPTQAEALTMVCARVLGNETSIAIASSQGNFQLNVYMPLIAYSFIQSARLLADSMSSFRQHALEGMSGNVDVIDENVKRSLMLVTSLNPHIGYDKAALVAKYAYENNTSLREAVLELEYLTGEEFDNIVVPEKLVGK